MLGFPSDTPGREQVLASASADHYTERQVADMATEQQDNSSTEDISGQEQRGEEQQAPTGDTSGNGEQQQAQTTEPPVVTKDAKLPDDHPVVKQLQADKAKLAKANSELQELRAKSAQVTKLEEDLGKRPTTEAMETLQTRYDRLEEFITSLPGPVGKALDSRSFTRDLFESDKSIADILSDWNKANPTATSAALGKQSAEPGKKGPSMNEILRAAAGS